MGRIENVEPRVTLALPETGAERLGTEAGAAHAEEDDVAQLAAPYLVDQLVELLIGGRRVTDEIEPAEPIDELARLRSPDRVILVPDALDDALLVESVKGFLDFALDGPRVR